MSNSAVEILNQKRLTLLDEQRKMNDKFQKEIDDLEVAILKLGGDVFLNTTPDDKYDDENPDQIKASLEEI